MRRGERGHPNLPERVAQVYYTHGVFIAAHPFPVIATAVALVLLACIPLANLPLPSNVPQLYRECDGGNSSVQNSMGPPKWVGALPPSLYIQQVIIKSAVSPWTDDLLLTDAIRAPLAEVFRLLEAIRNYRHPRSGRSLVDVCVHVDAPARSLPLPHYGCLLVSPANIWKQDPQIFYTDTALVSTVFHYQSVQVGKVTLAELLFGLNLKESGMKRYPLRKRQRIIQYAVTLFLNNHDTQYLDGLSEQLTDLYPLSNGADKKGNGSREVSRVVHIFYPGDFDFHEFLPLFFTYLMLYFYMYFSVRKIELVRSKVGMALSAVFTVVASLVMSVGLCLFFGLDPAGSSRGREVFPYLVVVVGLENILVLTKSVVSTPAHLDAKIRVAQGLSKEGWSITKNLLTEVTILTVGLFTLVPAIQEFCIFAMVGLLCDFFLQVCFFATVLSLDVRKIEAAEERRRRPVLRSTHPQQTLSRSRSTPRLDHPSPSPTRTRIPKRLRLVHFWASTRIVQRAFMLCMVVWIGGIIYSAGIVHNFVQIPDSDYTNLGSSQSVKSSPGSERGGAEILSAKYRADHLGNQDMKKSEWGPGWSRGLSPVKWCYLVSAYNGSGGPCRLALLPPLNLACAVPPSRAAALRNAHDPPPRLFRWKTLAQALDPADYPGDGDDAPLVSSGQRDWETPYLPTSPLEVLLVTALCVVSVVVIAYTALALYHCVCSRNYAQWRSAWGAAPHADATQVVLEAVPLVLEGHSSGVEWLASDGNTLASVCLAGEINIWDAATGERLAHANRKQYFTSQNNQKKRSSVEIDDQVMSDYDSGSPPSSKDKYYCNGKRTETVSRRKRSDFPDLTPAINLNFSCRTWKRSSEDAAEGFDYGSAIRQLYAEMKESEWDDGGDEEDVGASLESLLEESVACPPVWSMDSSENLLVLGTASGRLEFWEASTASFKCTFDDNCGIGVTCVKLAGNRAVVARLNGALEVLSTEWSSNCGHATYRRLGHARAQSAGGMDDLRSARAELRVSRAWAARAHHQPLTQLQVEASRILTGSHDHTLKVFSLVDQLLVFTLHGHCGPITSLFIDSVNPLTAGSGSQDGMLCVWDLLTGACVYSLDAHDGSVTALAYSASYVISLGSDERLCVWERFQGHLLNTIQVPQMYCSTMSMLTHNLLIASKQGSLVMWDVRTGEPVRMVQLGHSDGCVFIRTILGLRDSVACDYGQQVRIVRFPLVRDKSD